MVELKFMYPNKPKLTISDMQLYGHLAHPLPEECQEHAR